MRKIVIILGMHRSGTSVITQICQCMGVYLGKDKDLMEATQYNLSGFFENKEITYIDDELLRICNHEWYSLEPLIFDFNNPKIMERMNRLEDIISEMFEASNIIGIKDPRMSVMLSLWEKIFNKLADEVVYIWEFRNPLEVAASLERRDGFSKKHSLLLWIFYNLSILKFLRDKKYLLINYRDILKNSQVFYELAELLEKNMDDNLLKNINNLVKHEYCHSDFSNQVTHDVCGTILSDLYNTLLNKSEQMVDIIDLNNRYMAEIIQKEERCADNKLLKDINYLKNKELIIYGAGRYGLEAAKILQQLGFSKFNFCDRDIRKHGKNIFGGNVFSIAEIESKENKLIIIAVEKEEWKKEIEQTLIYVGQAEFISFNALKLVWGSISERKLNKKIVFWGTGNVASAFIKHHTLFMQAVEVVGFTDSNKNKWGTSFEQYKISCPNVLLNQNYDYILILSSYYKEIRENLLIDYSIVSSKILSIEEAYQMYIRNIYGTERGYQFDDETTIARFAFSSCMYDRMLKGIDDMLAYLYVKDKYADFITKSIIKLNKKIALQDTKIIKEHTPIWICWLQGLEDAPDIVKCCINSIIENVEGKKQIITYDNYFKFVKISETILEKHKQGIISKTHFSDILRLALLCKYGGIWIDSTVLILDKGLPDYIYRLPIFMYRIRETMDTGYHDPRLFTNWLIKSEKEHPIIKVVYEAMNKWWEMENETPYFIFHYVMRLVWNLHMNYETEDLEYLSKLVLYDNNCQILIDLLNKGYDEMLWNMLKEEQPIQKLSYKYEWQLGGSFYQHIIKKYGSGMFRIKE